MHSKIGFNGALLASALLAAACGKSTPSSRGASNPGATAEFARFSDPEGRFHGMAPANWLSTKIPDRNSPSLTLLLKAKVSENPDRLAVFALSINYYPSGRKPYFSAQGYVDSHRLPMRGLTIGPLKELQLHAGAAKRWDAVYPPLSAPELAPDQPRRRSFAVIPASKGFFVLAYDSPNDMHLRHLADFEEFLDEFSISKKAL